MAPLVRTVLLALGVAVLPAVEVVLAAPASTIVPVTGPVPTGGVVVLAEVTIPADAPTDLGIGAWAGDRHGTWAGRPAGRLAPGRHVIAITLGADAPADGPGGWGPAAAAEVAKAGLFFWSAAASQARLIIDDLRVEAVAPPTASALQVVDLAWPEAAATGRRWEATFRVAPEPADPYDPATIDATLTVTGPDGRQERHTAFWDRPMTDRDRGDAEEVLPFGPGYFAVRWRPRVPGLHHLHLTVTGGGTTREADLPAVEVTGAPWDGYARPDAQDPRFLSIAGRFFWPVGVNLRSVNDTRSVSNMNTRPLPERGTRAYAAYLDRFAAAGADAAEVWLSSWNLALEWLPRWNGYQGAGRYHLGHAWQLDRILDHAEANGQRLVLVLHNHGQGSTNSDREWGLHPYRRENGGFLDEAPLLFTDPTAQSYQARLHRYLVARYSDSPAVLAWKLWSEVNLTAAGQNQQWDAVAAWHQATAARLADMDAYDHPITTHFSGDWKAVKPEVVSQPAITMLTIDAYHGDARGDFNRSLAMSLFRAVATGPDGRTARSLRRHGKPVLTTEFGGDWSGGEEAAVLADHRQGAWVALISGHAGAPMLWWSSWVDQRGHFGPYTAIRAFLAGEDLRGGADVGSTALTVQPGDRWCGAWVRPGRVLGYVVTKAFAADGSDELLTGGTVEVGAEVQAGPMVLAWWDADRGTVLSTTTLQHPGGRLTLDLPPARGHVAFKLWRPTPP